MVDHSDFKGPKRGSVELQADSAVPDGGRAMEDGAAGGRCGGRGLVCRTNVGAEAPLVGAEAPAVAKTTEELLRETWGDNVEFVCERFVRGATVAVLDRGEAAVGADVGALSSPFSSIKLVKSQTGCLTITLRYQ
eukprot:SAG11_NODE_657_length_7898_cov_13.699320_8_plen_135_part_00